MPEIASLHIRDRGLKSARVVALSGDYVRVGRSPICDVLLLDPKVARVECHLTREAGRWTIIPERADGRVWYQGERLTGPLAIEEGQTIFVGENALTLRLGELSYAEPEPEPEPEPEREREPDPEPVPEPETKPMPEFVEVVAEVVESVSTTTETETSTTNLDHRAESTSTTGKHDRLLQTRAETRKWESRWRAVGEKLRETSVAPAAPPQRPAGTSVAPPLAHRRPAVTATEPPRSPVAKAVERSLPSASRITRETREIPIRSHSAIPSARPMRREVSPPIPASRPSYSSPSPTLSTPAVAYRTESPRKPVDLASSSRVFERSKPSKPDVLEETAAPEVFESTADRSAECLVAELVVESILEDEDEANRENEIPSKRTLGATRRLSRTLRVTVPSPALMPEQAARVPLLLEPAIEVSPEIEKAAVPLASAVSDPVIPTRAEEEPFKTPEIAAEGFLDVEFFRDPFVTITLPQDPLVWHESTVAATPFQMPLEVGSNALRADDSRPFEPTAKTDRHDRLRRSYLDQVPANGARRDPTSSQDWPSVSDIFANRPRRSDSSGTIRARTRSGTGRPRPEPTVVNEPDQWTLPLWLGWFPSSAAGLLILASLVGINWFWTVDNYHAGMVARRLDPKSGLTKPLPEGVEPGSTQWWRTSANHLLTWARYLDRSANDPAQLAESRELLKKASEISPLSPTVRHALAVAASEAKETDPFALAKAVGQSYDILTLTHAGGQLLRAGKMESAREAYRRALEMASKTEPDQPISPILDGLQIRRYSLPTEDLLAPVIRDMANQPSWSLADWESAIPRRTVAPLVAARVLQELRHQDARAALELARGDAISETLIAGSNRSENTVSAILLAAEAEALALDDKLKEALECYRSAIERMPIDRVVRSWWLNLAEIARRLNHDSERRKALELAKCDDPKDEITLQAIELQKDAGDFIGQTAGRAKKDPETKAASTSVE